MQVVDIGNTGISSSRLGFGTGTHGWNNNSDQTRIGHQKLVNLMKFAYDKGITLWDLADGYGSHPHFGDALKDIDRSSVTIITKTHSKSAETVKEEIPRFLKELGTDYIDILLMHCITNKNWLTDYADVIEVFQQAKEKGQVKAIGMSCHDYESLKTVASAEWVDAVLARINYNGENMDDDPDKIVPVLEGIKEAGKGVIGMKVYGQGKLADHAPKCMDYILGLSCVDVFVIGMVSEEQVLQNISLMS
ncbi:aldo/keto reductase [Candidatus Poribacteria bacterium]|nr:aldo/keto reductase [Candidatus Poribacteria bacterium]